MMNGRSSETEARENFSTSKCHGCNKAPTNDNNCNTSGWQKMPSTSGKLMSGGEPDAAGAYALQYARKINARTGKCATSPFLGSLHISGTTMTFLGWHHTAGGGYLSSTMGSG
jgi:hypothetical protein